MADQERLAEIAAREAVATPGPWIADEKNECIGIDRDEGADAITLGGTFWLDENLSFCAHARQDIPWLLARVAELEAERRWHPMSTCPNHKRVWLTVKDSAQDGLVVMRGRRKPPTAYVDYAQFIGDDEYALDGTPIAWMEYDEPEPFDPEAGELTT